MKSVAAVRRGKTPTKPALPKAPTGIKGFDEIALGGLPKGRPALPQASR